MSQERSMNNKCSKTRFQHIFFPNEDNFQKFCRKLKKCKKTFLGCIYQLTHQTIIEILVELAIQGCQVNIIMDFKSDEQDERKQITTNKLLVLSGFRVKVSLIECKGLMHDKFCVIDNKLTIFGSANWTYQAFSNNFEHLTLLKDSKTAKIFTEQFHVIWNQAKLAKFIDSQIIYEPNQNCVEFQKIKKFGKQKRNKLLIKKKLKKQCLHEKKKDQQLQNDLPQLKIIKMKQNLPLSEIQQKEDQIISQTINENELQNFLDNLKQHEQKKQNNSENITNNQEYTPWVNQSKEPVPKQKFFTKPKSKQTYNDQKNIIIIDDQ
ncbi:unnamed protein product [Paramecium sonneborni]|uniref:Mitochondrial cardiolipin hydrolase n=1 Tax=Paramecium sonneborni TaxID=65129 RepID=A0A8S1R0H5_9CILI|nr:unnamed protein product [Paramecium sonneborni]